MPGFQTNFKRKVLTFGGFTNVKKSLYVQISFGKNMNTLEIIIISLISGIGIYPLMRHIYHFASSREVGVEMKHPYFEMKELEEISEMRMFKHLNIEYVIDESVDGTHPRSFLIRTCAGKAVLTLGISPRLLEEEVSVVRSSIIYVLFRYIARKQKTVKFISGVLIMISVLVLIVAGTGLIISIIDRGTFFKVLVLALSLNSINFYIGDVIPAIVNRELSRYLAEEGFDVGIIDVVYKANKICRDKNIEYKDESDYKRSVRRLEKAKMKLGRK